MRDVCSGQTSVCRLDADLITCAMWELEALYSCLICLISVISMISLHSPGFEKKKNLVRGEADASSAEERKILYGYRDSALYVSWLCGTLRFMSSGIPTKKTSSK